MAASEVINEQRRRQIEREAMRNAESQSRTEETEASRDLRRREIDSAVDLTEAKKTKRLHWITSGASETCSSKANLTRRSSKRSIPAEILGSVKLDQYRP